MKNSVRYMIIGSIVLVLASMNGGDNLGSWFTYKADGVVHQDYSTSATFRSSINFMLTEYETEIMMDWEGSSDEKSNYDDSDAVFCDSGCDELTDLMIGKIQKLLYVAILAGFAAFYFLTKQAMDEDDEEKGAMACLVMGGAGLLAVAMFALSFPEAMDDDQNNFNEMDTEPSLFGDESMDKDGIEADAEWRPGIALALVALSGILGIAAYVELKN